MTKENLKKLDELTISNLPAHQVKTRATVTFRENGSPEGKSLQDFLKTAPKGTQIKIGGRVVKVL